MKKAGVENVTLKRILWISQGARIFSIHYVKKSVRRKKAFIAFLPSHEELFSDVVTISNQKIGEGIFGVISIDHINDFMGLKKENILYISMPYLKRVLQSLAGCDYFHYVFGVFDGKLVMELITCKDNKTVSISKMEKEKVRIGTLFVSVWHQQLSLCTLRTYCTLISSQIMFC